MLVWGVVNDCKKKIIATKLEIFSMTLPHFCHQLFVVIFCLFFLFRLQQLTIGHSVVANGLLVESSHSGQEVELQVEECEIIGECDGNVS